MLNLVQTRPGGPWYFAGRGIPPALAAVRTSDGKPCDDEDAQRVNACMSFTIAGVTTRYFKTADEGLSAAAELGVEGVAVLEAHRPSLPAPSPRQNNDEENDPMTKQIKALNARVADKTTGAQGNVTKVNRDHSVRVLFDGASKDKLVKVGSLRVVPPESDHLKQHSSHPATAGEPVPNRRADDPKPTRRSTDGDKAVKDGKKKAAVKPAAAKAPAAKKAAPERAGRKREPLAELTGAAFKRILQAHPAIRSPHHTASEEATRPVLLHLDSGDAWNDGGRYSLCRTKLTKWEPVPNQGKLEPENICYRCLPRAQREQQEKAAK